jgi:ABC-type uncharacterized transport system involved in gliding motility auxiliary subunit
MSGLGFLVRNRRLYAVLAILLGALVFIGVNMAANAWFRTARVDLTQGGLYTLSPGTKSILGKLKEPVTLRFYYSAEAAKDFPVIQSYAERVRDLLAEYKARAGGKIRVVEIEPRPFTPEEDEAQAYGLGREATRGGDTIYLGLVATNLADGQEVIPFFNPAEEARLEYELTTRISRLDTIIRPRLGLITNLPLDTGTGGLQAAMDGRSQPFAIYELLRQAFDLVPLEGGFTSIPSGITTLVIAHPRPLSEAQLYAIDQFVMRGGRVIAFVDPLSEVSRTANEATGEPLEGSTFSSDLALLRSWGVAYSPDLTLLDRGAAGQVSTGDPRNPVADYVLWPQYRSANFSDADVVTAALIGAQDPLNFASAGILKPREGATTTFTPMVTSSADAMTVETRALDSAIDPGAAMPETLLRRFLASGETYTVAARITGPVKSLYPDGPPPPTAADDGTPAPPPPSASAHLAETANANIIVVADSDLFDDRLWIGVGQDAAGRQAAREIALNGAFIAGAAEQMLGNDDLLSLRARRSSQRPFSTVDAIRKEDDRTYMAQEQKAQDKLEALRRELDEVARSSKGDVATITPDQLAQIERILAERDEARTELRDIQRRRLDRVETLGVWVKGINIALVPALLIAAAVFIAIVRRRRRLASVRAAAEVPA